MEYQADGCGNNGIGVERRGRNTLIQLPSVLIYAVLAEPVIARGPGARITGSDGRKIISIHSAPSGVLDDE